MQLWKFIAAIAFALPVLADQGTDTRAAFLKVIDRPLVAAKPELKEMPAVDGLRKEHLWFHSEATERVPGYLVFPDPAQFKGKRPVVIALHGTGGNKDDGLIASIALKAAKAGFIGVAIDGRHHGERTKAGRGAAEYNVAIARAFVTGEGHPFYFDTAWDVMRLVDYLSTRKDVDAARIGLTGISKGGIETYLTAGADTRIAASVPYIGVQSFKWALDNDAWQTRVGTFSRAFSGVVRDEDAGRATPALARRFYDRVTPGIYGEFDGPQMLPLIAPRPLLVINGDRDRLTPLPGVNLCLAAARSAYRETDDMKKFSVLLQPTTGHEFKPGAVRLALVLRVDYTQPVLEIQRSLAKLQQWEARSFFAAWLGSWVVVCAAILIAVAVLAGVDLWRIAPAYVILSLAVSLAGGVLPLLLHRWARRRGGRLAAWFDAFLLNRNIARASAAVAELDDFARSSP